MPVQVSTSVSTPLCRRDHASIEKVDYFYLRNIQTRDDFIDFIRFYLVSGEETFFFCFRSLFPFYYYTRLYKTYEAYTMYLPIRLKFVYLFDTFASEIFIVYVTMTLNINICRASDKNSINERSNRRNKISKCRNKLLFTLVWKTRKRTRHVCKYTSNVYTVIRFTGSLFFRSNCCLTSLFLDFSKAPINYGNFVTTTWNQLEQTYVCFRSTDFIGSCST